MRAELRADSNLFVELLIPKLSPERGMPEADLPSSPSGQEQVLRPSRRDTFDVPYTNTSYLQSPDRSVPRRGTQRIHRVGQDVQNWYRPTRAL